MLQQEQEFVVSALCFALSQLEVIYSARSNLENMFLGVDFTESGITRDQMLDWWKVHKESDVIRRARAVALGKLSAEERMLLGINEKPLLFKA